MKTLTVHERAGHQYPGRVARVDPTRRDGVIDGVRAQRLGHGRGYRRRWVGGGSCLAALFCCSCVTGDESRRRCPRGAFSSIQNLVTCGEASAGGRIRSGRTGATAPLFRSDRWWGRTRGCHAGQLPRATRPMGTDGVRSRSQSPPQRAGRAVRNPLGVPAKGVCRLVVGSPLGS